MGLRKFGPKNLEFTFQILMQLQRLYKYLHDL